ncbi:MAG: hypothetical protein Q7K57_48605 [Burkholderiaceae bacterium]|nr:hypothetical protein [Burkholderiaceae bacterium]
MTAAELISILQRHDPAAFVVLSMCPGEDTGDRDVVTVEPADICAVQLRAIDDEEYRKRYTVALDGMAGVWLG